jgi:hypothetical protein
MFGALAYRFSKTENKALSGNMFGGGRDTAATWRVTGQAGNPCSTGYSKRD